jgi:hypothetical protein
VTSVEVDNLPYFRPNEVELPLIGYVRSCLLTIRRSDSGTATGRRRSLPALASRSPHEDPYLTRIPGLRVDTVAVQV